MTLKSKRKIQLETRDFYLNGKTALAADSLELAENNFKKALYINPFFAPAYEGLALLSCRQKDYKNAEKLFNKALSVDINWIPAEIGLLQVMIENGDLEQALESCEKISKNINDSRYNPNIRQKLLDETSYWKMTALRKTQSNLILMLGDRESLIMLKDRENILRAEFTAAFMDVFSQEIYQLPVVKFTMADDLPDSLAQYEQIMGALKYGIVNSYPDNLFRPYHIMKRAEVALIIDSFLGKIGLGGSAFGKGDNIVSDIYTMSPIYYPINRVVELGIMRCDHGSFYPDQIVSSSEFFYILFRLRELVTKHS